MSSRRKILKLIGGGTVIAAAGLGGFVVTHGHSVSARRAWRNAGAYQDPRMRALSYAILAPNPHNMQPWQVRLEGDDGLVLFCDKTRLLPETDPFSRQITLGFGTFLELLRIAAAQEGITTHITPFPEGENMQALDGRPLAYVRFEANTAEPDPLFRAILDRRSNREEYTSQNVETEKLKAIEDTSTLPGVTARTTGNSDLAARLRELTWNAHVIEMTTQRTLMESVNVMRIGKREVSAQPNGLALEGPAMSAMNIAGLVNRDTLGDQTSTAFLQGMKLFQKLALSARAFGWLLSGNATRADQLNAGRAYARLNLKATELGLAIHPWSQSLQEYPEMADQYGKVHQLLSEGQTVQMLVRIGYARQVIAAPRYELDTHIV